jgi:hypothetical protein
MFPRLAYEVSDGALVVRFSLDRDTSEPFARWTVFATIYGVLLSGFHGVIFLLGVRMSDLSMGMFFGIMPHRTEMFADFFRAWGALPSLV